MWRWRVWIRNLRRSAAWDLGHGVPAKVSTGARNICAARARESPEISEDARRLSSGHIKPSASAWNQARLPFRGRPQAMHSVSSGRKPTRRVSHNSKYVTGIQMSEAVFLSTQILTSELIFPDPVF